MAAMVDVRVKSEAKKRVGVPVRIVDVIINKLERDGVVVIVGVMVLLKSLFCTRFYLDFAALRIEILSYITNILSSTMLS